jgi:pilus assembly protein Flp/PilA
VNKLFLGLYVRLQLLLNNEDGQDLVEYALLVALIALAAVTGVKEVASAVNTTFSHVSTTLG